VPARIVDAATRSHGRALLLLVTVALVAFLPGFFAIPPVDRDEARFSQATKQMIETGDYINIRFQDETRFKKPIGIYWLQAAVVQAAHTAGVGHARTRIWLYRVPSLAGAIGAVGLTYWAALALVSRRAAVLAGLLMAGSVLLGIEARLATTDAVLLLTTVAAMGGLARLYLRAHGRPQTAAEGVGAAAVVWTALALGVLVKGPVIVLVAGLCVTVLAVRDRSIRWLAGLRPLAGLPWFAALTLPWVVTVMAQDARLLAEWTGDIFPRLWKGMDEHAAPPGYYFLLFWVTFWPGSALAGLAAPAVLAARRDPATAFLLAWLVPSWIVFELAVTKLPHYVLPLYPSVAILIAGGIGAPAFSRRPILLKSAVWMAVMPLALGSLGIAALGIIDRRWDAPAMLLCGGAVATAAFGWRQLLHGRTERAVLSGVMAALLLSAGVCGVILPRLRAAFPSAAVAELLDSRGCTTSMTVTAPTYDEPSLVFLAGTGTRVVDVPGAVAFLAGGSCRFALIDDIDEARFVSLADAARLRYERAGRINGINYSKGTPVTLAAYWSGAAR
jgi:4-amino-4-deoxy-L-arabinose transferase-like glycosyltransferase